ncbi:MAG: DUF4382 domain-containing protein [Gammaproteobacteria bacterium]|nr:DUF4382 domain-containing protein [Gammaproteobacteria bacterium]MCF6229410.1 DUF4382 domain-containing protein [Gammaproteobacteria bacterium]
MNSEKIERSKYQPTLAIRHGLMALLLSLVLILSGCNDSGSDVSSGDGELYISLTDAEGDFSSYTVDVTAISLQKADGTVIETLPITTRVDFAQYVDMSELLTAATLPSGVYVKGTLTIDYSNADIWVEDGNGVPVQVAPENLRDETGTPLNSTVDLSVRLEDHNTLLIVPGLPSHLTLDFDLNASHQTDFTGDAPVVTVRPVLVADIDLEKNKPHRVRGPLQHVDLADSSYQIYLRPFHQRLSSRHRGDFGELTVKTTDETIFQIDGEMYKGERGLQMLALKERFTATIALGDLTLNPRQFEAREVYAGRSVPGGEQSVVKGNVTSRNGEYLTVRAATLIRSGGGTGYRQQIIVTIGPDTKVTKQLSMEDHDIAAISVGARVTIFGEITPSITTVLALDAQEGLVHLEMTTLSGSVVDNNQGVVMNLEAIDRHRIAPFDFTGTGTSSEYDADPAHYELETATLDSTQLKPNDPLRVRGFVTPFGTAPADFTAHTLISSGTQPALMVIDWAPASASAISRLDNNGMVLNLEGVGRFHHVSLRGERIDLTTQAAPPTLLAGETGMSHYVIIQGESYHLHQSFESFVTELKNVLSSGGTVKRLEAPGEYLKSDGSLTARRLTLYMQ